MIWMASPPYVLNIRTARAVPTPWLCRKTVISRTTFCSAQPATIRPAHTGPMPSTSRRRAGCVSMTSNTLSPKDQSNPLPLLRPRRKRPRGYAAEQRDDLAPSHSITSSAMASNDAGTVRPSVFAVLRLITSTNLVGSWTGRSAGLAPLRIRST